MALSKFRSLNNLSITYDSKLSSDFPNRKTPIKNDEQLKSAIQISRETLDTGRIVDCSQYYEPNSTRQELSTVLTL